MSDIRFDNAMNANTDVDTEHADASAGAGYDGSLSASDAGASYDGGLDGSVDYSTQLPDAPELPELPGAAADATATVDATVDGVHAQADAAVHAATGAQLPDLPEADVPDVHGSLDVSAAIDVMVDAMGQIGAHISGAISAMLGL